jgi:hypothetical protein
MSKLGDLLIENEYWGFSFFKKQRESYDFLQDVTKKSWGNNHANLANMGKLMSEMEWHAKPKRFMSPSKQVELYFNCLKMVQDGRTRRIIAANIIDYYVSVTNQEFEQLKKKKGIEFKYKTTYTLHFDIWGLYKENNQLWQEAEMAEMADEPFVTYREWVENGTEEQRAFALKYGVIEEVQIPMVKKKSMSHRFYTWSRAKKYISKDYVEIPDSYLNTSMTYQIPSKKDFRRLGERVTEFCLLFSEIDYYKIKKYKNKTQKKMLELIYKELDKHGFPRPTEIVYPRGLHLIWKISPIPAYRSFE